MKLISILLIIILLFSSIVMIQNIDEDISRLSCEDEYALGGSMYVIYVVILTIVIGITVLPLITRLDRGENSK